VKTEKNTGTIAFRFRQVLLYYYDVVGYLSSDVTSGALQV